MIFITTCKRYKDGISTLHANMRLKGEIIENALFNGKLELGEDYIIEIKDYKISDKTLLISSVGKIKNIKEFKI